MTTDRISAATTFTYTPLGQLASLTDAENQTTRYTYDARGLKLTETYPDHTTALTQSVAGLTPSVTFNQAFDAMSNRTELRASIGSTADFRNSYTYDALQRLTGIVQLSQSGGNSVTAKRVAFSYNNLGQRTQIARFQSTGTANPAATTDFTYDTGNRLTRVVYRNSAGGAIVRQGDYEYDAFNRLVRRAFDADGTGAGVATNQYWVYDEGINAVLQFDGSAASNLSHRYLWSDNVDELLADEVVTSPSSGGYVLWGLADHLGTIRDIADLNESTGSTSITNHRRFNSFGALVSESNAAVDLLFAYTGKQFDEATGLQHNLNRWYDPAIGQWISEDPIGFSAGDENVRRYVGNGVVDSIDPTGLQEPTFNYSTMYLYESFRAGVPLSAYGPQTDFGSYAWNYTGHFFDAWGDYITWWNGTPGGDTFDQVATGITATAQIVGVAAGTAAGGVYVWGVVGAPTMGAGIVTTSETSVIFTVNGSTFMGTSSGLVSVPTGYYTLGYWTSITGVPILSGEAAIAGAGGGLWISNHPCLSRAIQAFVHGWLP